MLSLAALLTTFVVIFPVELPDKTFLATLVLATRYRRARPVLLGAVLAFAVQVVIAVAFGSVLRLLPEPLVAGVVALLFGLGAFLLLREGFAEPDADAEERTEQRLQRPWWRISATSFAVLFAAEWGDASQLAVAALAARLGEPVSVGLGAWVALALVATIAVVLGKRVAGRLPMALLHKVAGVVFAGFAVLVVVEQLLS